MQTQICKAVLVSRFAIVAPELRTYNSLQTAMFDMDPFQGFQQYRPMDLAEIPEVLTRLGIH